MLEVYLIIFVLIQFWYNIPGLSNLADVTRFAPLGKREGSGYLPGGRREARPVYQSPSCTNQLNVPEHNKHSFRICYTNVYVTCQIFVC